MQCHYYPVTPRRLQTNGYKKTIWSFQSLFTRATQSIGRSGQRAFTAAQSLTTPGGVGLVQMGYDMSQGSIRDGSALNAAINGAGFFVLESGRSYQHLLTRASDFIFSADGTLVDVFGRKVKGYRMVNGNVDKSELVDITIDPDTYDLSDVGFESGGVLTTNFFARQSSFSSPDDDGVPEGEQLFQLAVANVSNSSQMQQVEGNAFTSTRNSGSISTYGVSSDTGLGTVVGASIESSNVNPSENAIQAIQLQTCVSRGARNINNGK